MFNEKLLVEDAYNVSNDYERRVTIYFNSIGGKPDKVLKIALKYAGFRNPKVKMTTFGPFKVHKYSYLVNVSELKPMMDRFYHYIHDYNKRYMLLRQNKDNLYLMECIDFYED